MMPTHDVTKGVDALVNKGAAVTLREDVRNLTVKLTMDELTDRSGVLARLVGDIGEEENAQKEQKSAMKAKLEGMANQLRGLARVVASGEEVRAVKVVVQITGEGMVREVRADTGELVIVRVPTAEERQAALDLKEA